jgi:phytoene synthase
MSGQSSFYWPMRLAAEPQRSALFAVYAWCRYMDDIVDGAMSPDDKARAIAVWRDYFLNERSATAMNHDGLMVAMTLSAAIAAHGLPPALFLRVIDGMEMDLAGEMRAPALAALEAYAHAVAGAPGELVLHVLGWRGEDAAAFSRVLGEAVQYTNILRDVSEDAAQGRLYLPRETLDSTGIAAQDPAIVLADARVSNAWLALALMAEAKFHQAESLLPDAALRRRIRPALAMMAVYRILWKRLRRTTWHPGAAKVTVPHWRAMLATLRVAWLGATA